MKAFFIRITMEDPYPKHYEYTKKASDIGTAVNRAIKDFRKKAWHKRPIKLMAIQVAML